MIAGNTRIYGIKLVDKLESKDYSLAATVRDLYDTLSSEGDNVEIYLKSNGGVTMSDSITKVKSINKVESDNVTLYKITSIVGGLNEEMTGNDTSLYCTEDTRIKINGVVTEVSLLGLSREYEISKLEMDRMDLYEIKLSSFDNGSNIIRTNVDINGLSVMLI
jgi:hypothetical protein